MCIRLHELAEHLAKPKIEIGKPYPTPCKHQGIIIWISPNQKTIAVKCTEKHITHQKTLFGKTITKTNHPIYIIKVETENVERKQNHFKRRI